MLSRSTRRKVNYVGCEGVIGDGRAWLEYASSLWFKGNK